MSDERSDGDETTESPTDVDEDVTSPGGGPKRVVSGQSVDDILESLSETKGAEPDPSDRTVNGRGEEKNEVNAPSDLECTDGSDLESETDDDPKRRLDAQATVEPTEDGLEARIESGEVTGADVRAAEAGEGREPTPAVDEIDLTLEDVERPAPTESEGEGTRTDREKGEPKAADGDTEDGLLARIRGLFSR